MSYKFQRFSRLTPCISKGDTEWGRFPFEGLNMSQVELYYLLYGEYMIHGEKDLEMTNRDLGDFLQATPETISRHLSKLEEGGFIVMKHKPSYGGTKRSIKVLKVPGAI
jgi:DNA-binding MarR family transcriptional regulator